jgi:hypothetical protein
VRRWSVLSVAGLATMLVAACGGGSDTPGWDARSVSESQQSAPFSIIVASSPPGIGLNRLTLGLADEGALLTGAQVTLRVYRLAERPEDEPDVADLRFEQLATPRSIANNNDHIHGDGAVHVHEGPTSTVYVAIVEFDSSGWWGIEADVTLDGATHEGLRANFWVREATDEPAIGDPVPRSEQVTLRDVDDIAEIDSTNPANPEFHELTVAEALDTGRPVLVAFVTPAFCQTRFCGPVMEEVILPTYEAYGDRIEVIHIEPFDLQAARSGTYLPVPTVSEWGLLTEPFLFVVDSDGTVAAKFEGIMEAEEVAAALDLVLAP